MKANPGGNIDSAQVIGRDEVIDQIWDTLEQQSVRQTAERRIGKTTITKKMRDEPRDGWFPVFQDLEKFHTAAEFAMGVYREVDKFLTKSGKAANRARKLLETLSGAEIGGVFKLPESAAKSWKDILTRSIEDLVKERGENDDRLLFLWDEMPFMLDEICKRDGELVAMEVLDVLRSLRQDHPDLRMLVTGSIGIHHVLSVLRDADYRGEPLNDLFSIEIEPLGLEHATQLARQLVEGEKLEVEDIHSVAQRIASVADGFPFYIHHLVKALVLRGEKVTLAAVDEAVSHQLMDEDDPWELVHYRTRIDGYYGQDAPVVLPILDHLAAAAEPSSPNEILALLKQVSEFADRERLLELLKLMAKDHYIKRETTGGYRFRFPLVQRWWKLDRGL